MRSSADVVVVGGGIIGCSTAAALARAGADVILVERNEIAHGASGRNHGLLLHPQMQACEPLYRQSLMIYERIAEESKIDISMDRTPVGMLVVVEDEVGWGAAEAEASASARGGIKIEKLDQNSLRHAEPNLAKHYLGAWLIDDGRRLDPTALTLALATDARSNGAEVMTHTDVKQILVADGKVTGVATDAGIIDAPIVVDAAGPWAPKLARRTGVELPITGARGWLLLTHRMPKLTDHLVVSSGWHNSAAWRGSPTVSEFAKGSQHRDIGLLLQQDADGRFLIGGSRISSVRDDPENEEVAREIAESASRAIPLLADAPVAAVWSGVRPMSNDGLPLIGWLPGVEGFFVCGGHGGQGMINGGGSGLLAAQIVRGGATFTSPTPFDPGRGGSSR